MTRWRHSFLLACLLWAGSVQAHTLDLSTARVTLRDQHIEVMVELDPFLLVQVGPTAIATESEPELLSHLQQARQLLDSETKLEVDGVRVGLALRGFPSAPEFRAMAATLYAAQKEHGDLIRLRLEAPQAVPNAKTLALSLPTTLGPSVVSFVQPSTRYAAPGESSVFSVLRAPVVPSAWDVRRYWFWLWFGGFAVVATLVASIFFNRRVQHEET